MEEFSDRKYLVLGVQLEHSVTPVQYLSRVIRAGGSQVVVHSSVVEYWQLKPCHPCVKFVL